MRNNPMRGVLFGVVIGTAMWMMAGCQTWMKAYVAIHDATDAALSNKPPAVVTNLPPVVVPQTDPAHAVDTTGQLVDPYGYTESGVSANAHNEECSIEPHTGLLIRVPVWRPSVKNWWMLSTLIEGHVKLEGNRSSGTLVCETFERNGQIVECLGACNYELHAGDTPDNIRWTSKGNRVPYKHERVYLVWVCREKK